MKVKLDFEAINTRIKHIPFPDVDLVVGIATGGIVPASLVAHQICRPMKLMHINYRDVDNEPQYERPMLLKLPDLPDIPCRILLVDDISLTGSTFAVAREQLNGHKVFTFAMKGELILSHFQKSVTRLIGLGKLSRSRCQSSLISYTTFCAT